MNEKSLSCASPTIPDAAGDAHGPEAAILGLIELMKLEAGMGGIQLQIEGGGVDGFLLVRGEARDCR